MIYEDELWIMKIKWDNSCKELSILAYSKCSIKFKNHSYSLIIIIIFRIIDHKHEVEIKDPSLITLAIFHSFMRKTHDFN